MFDNWIEDAKLDFAEGRNDDLASYTRRIVRSISGHDVIGDIDGVRKLLFVGVELSEEQQAKLKDIGAW